MPAIIIPYNAYKWLRETMDRMRTGLHYQDQEDKFNPIHALMTTGLAYADGEGTDAVYRLTEAGEDELTRHEVMDRAFRIFLEDGDTCALRADGAAGVLALCDALDAGAGRHIERLCAYQLLRQYAQIDADLYEPQTKTAPAWIVDTREQKPLTPMAWTGRYELVPCDTKSEGLSAGDYRVFDCTDIHGKAHNILLVERKSPEDLIGSLTSGLDRLRSEMLKAAQQFPRVRILVECWPHIFWGLVSSRVPEGRLDGRVRQLQAAMDALSLDYGVGFVWCESRDDAARWLGWMGQRIEAMLKDPKKRKQLFERGLDKVAPWMVRGKGE